MQIAGPSLWIAPLATGHPHGLPGVKRPEKQSTKVQPLDQSRNPDAALARHQAPENFWKAANGDPVPEDHIAPPTIMQLKISQMLDEQAQEMEATLPIQNSEADPQQPAKATEMPQVDDGSKGQSAELSKHPPSPATTKPLPAYDEVASISRNEVLSTLP